MPHESGELERTMDAPAVPLPAPLQALLRQRKLKKHYAADGEVAALVDIARTRLQDARNAQLNIGSRYDLAYYSVLAASLAALRWYNCRTDSAFLIFQSLQFTAGLAKPEWRTLNQARQRYDFLELHWQDAPDARMLQDLLEVATQVLREVEALTVL